MALAPRGQSRTVPDPAGDLYDQEMAKLRAKREAEDGGFRSPLDVAQAAFNAFQDGPDIPRPNLAQSFIPVVGPAWEAVADLQDGNYGGAAFNGLMAVGDVLPVGAAVKGLRAASKGIPSPRAGRRRSRTTCSSEWNSSMRTDAAGLSALSPGLAERSRC